jgi:hypothetical protein
MAVHALKYIENSKTYKYVQKYKEGAKIKWLGKVFNTGKTFDEERKAALYVDKVLLSKGKEPVNILVRKQTYSCLCLLKRTEANLPILEATKGR